MIFAFRQTTLPINRTVCNSSPIGWTNSPLDSYTSTFACSGSNGAKFDTSGDNKTVFFTGTPNDLTFVVKSNSTTSSNLLVEESIDGISYSTVISLTGTANLPTSCTAKGPYILNPSTRYVKWTFTKSGSNMTMDDVVITSGTPPTPSDIILNSGNPATTASNITQGENNHVIYDFDISASTASATLTDLDFTTSGTYAASNITNFKLWY